MSCIGQEVVQRGYGRDKKENLVRTFTRDKSLIKSKMIRKCFSIFPDLFSIQKEVWKSGEKSTRFADFTLSIFISLHTFPDYFS